MVQGYNIQCDPGDLYNRKCYTVYCTDATGAVCDCGTAGCINEIKEEVIAYTSGGDPISKKTTGISSWMAWIPSITKLNLTGQAYRPYGEAGIPWTPFGMANVNGGGVAANGTGETTTQTTEVEGQAATQQLNRRNAAVIAASAIGVTLGAMWVAKKIKVGKAV